MFNQNARKGAKCLTFIKSSTNSRSTKKANSFQRSGRHNEAEKSVNIHMLRNISKTIQMHELTICTRAGAHQNTNPAHHIFCAGCWSNAAPAPSASPEYTASCGING